MMTLTTMELREIILELGLSCDLKMVEKWLKEGSLKSIKNSNHFQIYEQDIDNFVYDAQWNGTAFERGIDDAEKIERLLLEIRVLKEQVSELQDEKIKLEYQLDIEQPF